MFSSLMYLSVVNTSLAAPVQYTYDWTITWGTTNADDVVEGMALDLNTGDIYLVGYTNKSGIDYDLLLIKYNKDGVLLWNVTANFTSGDQTFNDYGYDVAVNQTTGDVYVTGYKDYWNDDTFLIKYNSTGVQQWNTTWAVAGSPDRA